MCDLVGRVSKSNDMEGISSDFKQDYISNVHCSLSEFTDNFLPPP